MVYWNKGIVLAVFAGCIASERDGAPAVYDGDSLQTVTVVSHDYGFRAPDRVAAGETVFRLVNEGHEWHHIQLIRLEGGKTLADLTPLLNSGERLPAWVQHVGGPNAVAVHDTSEATVTMEPGRYAMICVIPSPDGTPHFVKGMMHAFEVDPSPHSGASRPTREDAVIRLVDYGFDIQGKITSGRRTLRIENAGPQVHEVVFFRLAPGRTAQDVLTWMEDGGTGHPPGVPVGGVVGLDRGRANIARVEFAPGEYALVCFVPDDGDGAPHFVHGMITQIKVS